MITRAQAEALLTLAESLEACERLGTRFLVSDSMASIGIAHGVELEWVDDLTSISIRVALSGLIPKQEIQS